MSHHLYWLTRDLSEVPVGEDWLSERERSRAAGMRFPKRRNDWKLGRWTAKRAIRLYQPGAVDADSGVEIRTAADGAPEARLGGEPGRFSISISHSRERSLCAIGPIGFEVGCDLEFIEPRDDNFLLDYFTPEERSLVEQTDPHDRPLASTLIWSAKESGLKVLRQGLRMDTRSIRVAPDFGTTKGGWHSWTGRCLEAPQKFYGWWRTRDNFVYTIASNHPTSPPLQLENAGPH